MVEFPEYKVQDVAVLLPSSLNARTHSDEQVEQIVRSIREYGFTNPLIVDDENKVLAGHGRLMAAKRIGMDRVPTVRMSDLTPEQKRAYMLADNKLALDAGWDEEILRIEISNLRDAGFDLTLTGFNQKDVDQLFAPTSDVSALWQSMPEFNQPNAFAFRSMVVHFSDQAGVDQFKELLDRPEITAVTKFIWFPPIAEESYMDRHYVTDGAAPTNDPETAASVPSAGSKPPLEDNGDGVGAASSAMPRRFKRAVQLLFLADELPGFMEQVRLLSERYGTSNISETIAKAIAYESVASHAEQ